VCCSVWQCVAVCWCVTRLTRMCDMTHGAISTPINVVKQSMLHSLFRVTQYRRTFYQKSPYFIKRALYFIRRALYSTPATSSNKACFGLVRESLKRDLHSIKRAQYSPKRDNNHLLKALCSEILWNEPDNLPHECDDTKHAGMGGYGW